MDQDTRGEISREARAMVSVEWKVPDFFKLPRQVCYSVESPTFLFSGAQWKLSVFPNGDCIDFSDWIGLHLIKLRSFTEKHHIEYRLGIKKADGTEYESMTEDYHFHHPYNVAGSQMFVKISSLRNDRRYVAPQGAVTFFCKLHSKANDTKDFTFQTSEGAAEVVDDLKNLLSTGEASDLILKVKNREFRVHSAILAARSSVFAAMMRNDMKERRSRIVEIKEYEPDTFQQFLHFIYSGNIENFSMDTVCTLFVIADKYDTGTLRTSCIQFMMDNLSVEKFCNVLSLSLRYDESELLEMATVYFANNIKKILDTEEWLSFVKENPVQAIELHKKVVDLRSSK